MVNDRDSPLGNCSNLKLCGFEIRQLQLIFHNLIVFLDSEHLIFVTYMYAPLSWFSSWNCSQLQTLHICEHFAGQILDKTYSIIHEHSIKCSLLECMADAGSCANNWYEMMWDDDASNGCCTNLVIARSPLEASDADETDLRRLSLRASPPSCITALSHKGGSKDFVPIFLLNFFCPFFSPFYWVAGHRPQAIDWRAQGSRGRRPRRPFYVEAVVPKCASRILIYINIYWNFWNICRSCCTKVRQQPVGKSRSSQTMELINIPWAHINLPIHHIDLYIIHILYRR